MARDAFLQPFDKTDPWNYPLGDGAVYAIITDTGFLADRASFPEANASQGLRCGFGWGGAADAYTRNLYYYNGASWIIGATFLVPDSLAWRQELWGGPAIAPTAQRDNPVTVWTADKETFAWMRHVYRYDFFTANGGPTIAGANGKDLVMVKKQTTAFRYYPGKATKGFAWKTLNSEMNEGAARTTRALGIRQGELTAANGLGVTHAVPLILSRKYWNHAGAGNGNPYVWPAGGVDTNAEGTYAGNGNIFLGSRFALLTSLDLTTFAAAQAALGLETTQGWALARVFQDYGAYGIDSHGDPQRASFFGDQEVILQDLGGYGSALLTDFRQDVLRIVGSTSLRVITNNYGATGGAPATSPQPGGSTGTLRRLLLDDFTGGTPIPAAPTSHVIVNAVVGGWTSQWDASGVLGETGFDLQYRSVPGSYPGSPQITNIPADATERVVTGIAAGDWAAQPRSKNASGESAWANEATVTVPAPPTVPAAASNVAGTAVDYRTIDWTWTDNSTNEDEFKIQVSKNGGAYAQVASVGANVTTYRYVDSTPGSGLNDYTAKVVASNATGDAVASAASDVVTTPSPPNPGQGGVIVYPSSPIYPNAASKVFPRSQDVKFPS